MQAVEPLGLQHIEVFRGANALQYGATTLGGAINFVTPTGYTSDLVRARAELGSFGYYKGFGSTGGVRAISTTTSRPRTRHRTVTAIGRSRRMRGSSPTWAGASMPISKPVYLTALSSDSQLPGALTKAQAQTNPQQQRGQLCRTTEARLPFYRIADKTLAYRVGDGTLGRRARPTRIRTCGIQF